MNNKTIRVEISYKTIVFIALFLMGIMALWHLRTILALFFVCTILMEALNPVVAKLEKKGITRPVAILIIYVAILFFVSVALASIVPPLLSQITGLITFLPRAITGLGLLGISPGDISSQLRLLEGLPGQIAKTTLSIFSNFVGGIVVLMITFYMLLERRGLNKKAKSLLGVKNGRIFIEIVKQVENRLTGWTKAELFLMLIVGGLSYVGYVLLGIDFAMALAIIAGILEVVPNVGPTISTILAVIVALNKSVVIVVLTIVWGILVQQLENNLIVPRVMKRQVGLSPVVTLFCLIVGARLGGVPGTILAIPSFIAIDTAVRVFLESRRDK